MPSASPTVPDGRELHEVVRDEDGHISGILRPPAPDLSELSEKVLALVHAAGTREGFREGARAGVAASARAYIEAGVRAGYEAGLEAGLDAGFSIGWEYAHRWPNGGGPGRVPVNVTLVPATIDTDPR